MRQTLLFACLALLLCSVTPALALDLQNVDPFSIYNANSYMSESTKDYFIFLSGGSPNNIMIADYTGNYYTIGYGNNTVNNPISVYCSWDGKIYFSSSSGVYRYMITKGSTSPKNLGLPENYQFVSSDTEVYSWFEDSNYIYYWSGGSNSIKRINKSSTLVSNQVTYTYTYYTATSSQISSMNKVGTSFYNTVANWIGQLNLIMVNNNDPNNAYLLTSGQGTGPSWTMSGSEWINDTCLYVGATSRHDNGAISTFNIKRLSRTGTNTYSVLNDMGISFTYSTTNRPSMNMHCLALGKNNAVMAYANGRHLSFVEVFDLGISGTPDSSDGSSGTTTDQYETGHEWTDEEMSNEGRKIIFPLFLIVLVFWVLEVIGGK
ncbi:hypothetical protein [Methanolobus chelungpuianus]|uniref:Uncharacterized protein n=1 Tax=Methanolobus chelungpuianus TaxID=502115 RepID=A0AAE3HAY3_9EURY|nr:hypothetical protein [Methanolobus chelungpuianus]MCQ6962799.1 hypothetical protein [Methanolobus chelungpuianus]